MDIQSGGGGGVTPGITPVIGGTVGSVLFVGTGPVIQQDNANFFWDDTNNALGIGTTTPFGTVVGMGLSANEKGVRVKGTGVATTSQGVYILEGNNSTNVNANLGRILFCNNDGVDVWAGIQIQATNVGFDNPYLSITARNTSAGSNQEIFRFKWTGGARSYLDFRNTVGTLQVGGTDFVEMSSGEADWKAHLTFGTAKYIGSNASNLFPATSVFCTNGIGLGYETGDTHVSPGAGEILVEGGTNLTLNADNTLNVNDFKITTAGKGLFVKEGANAKMGQAVLVGGTVTVNTTAVTANSRIQLTHAVVGGTIGIVSVGTITAATSFVINSSNPLDTSTINWFIIEPA